jgi:hypothetical protein
VRTHRDELILAGALTRVGRVLVVMAAGYSRWLEKSSAKVVLPDSLRGAALAAHERREDTNGKATS